MKSSNGLIRGARPCDHCGGRLIVRQWVQRSQSRARVESARLSRRCKSRASAVADKDIVDTLDQACAVWKQAPPSEKLATSRTVADAFKDLQSKKLLQKWGAAAESLNRRNIQMGELRMVGIRKPEIIGKANIRNEAVFLGATVVSTSLIAVLAGQLPGDWGFFVPFLVGGSSLLVLTIGSTSPGILRPVIDQFSLVFPDYRERVCRHEAAHFLVGYLMGLPVTRYSISIGKQATEFIESRNQTPLSGRILEDIQVDQYSTLAMAGAASEAMKYEEVVGQYADLSDLQRILDCSKNRLNRNEQQNMTRWAVYQAANLLRQWPKEYTALQAAMSRGASVAECVSAIEQA